MTFDANRIIRDELDPRERLLWAAQPQQGLKLQAADLVLIPFGLLWSGFIAFWEYSVISEGGPLFFALFGVPFILIGLYIVFGRFFVAARQREKTFYGLTNERIIIVSGLFRKNIKSLSLKTLADISLAESSDSRGSIAFGPSMPFAAYFSGTGWPGIDGQLGPRFDLIDHPRAVYRQIRDAQRAAS